MTEEKKPDLSFEDLFKDLKVYSEEEVEQARLEREKAIMPWLFNNNGFTTTICVGTYTSVVNIGYMVVGTNTISNVTVPGPLIFTGSPNGETSITLDLGTGATTYTGSGVMLHNITVTGNQHRSMNGSSTYP